MNFIKSLDLKNSWYPTIDATVILLWPLVFQPKLVKRFYDNDLEQFIDWMNISSILLPVLQFGLVASFVRYYFDQHKSNFLATTLLLHFSLFITSSSILYFFNTSIDILLYCLANFILTIFLYLRRFNNDVLEYLILSLLFPMAFTYISLNNNEEILFNSFIIALKIPTSIIICIYIIKCVKLIRDFDNITLSRKVIYKILKYSSNAYVGSILILIMGRILVYYSKENLEMSEYALFSILLSFSNIPVVISGLISKLFIHKLYNLRENKQKIYKQYLFIYIPLMLIILLLFPFLSQELYPSFRNIQFYTLVILSLKSFEQLFIYVNWDLQNNNKLKALYVINFIPLMGFVVTISLFEINSALLFIYFSICLLFQIIIKNKKLYTTLYV